MALLTGAGDDVAADPAVDEAGNLEREGRVECGLCPHPPAVSAAATSKARKARRRAILRLLLPQAIMVWG